MYGWRETLIVYENAKGSKLNLIVWFLGNVTGNWFPGECEFL